MIGQFRLRDFIVKLPVKEVRAKNVEHQHRAVISIARQRANKLIRVIGSPAAAMQDNWDEF